MMPGTTDAPRTRRPVSREQLDGGPAPGSGTTAGAAFWNRRSSRYEDAIRRHGPQYDHRIRTLASLLRPTDVVLDLGCATGEIALDVAPLVQHVVGIDTSDRMIERAIAKAEERDVRNVTFRSADAFDPALMPNSFTAILSLSVFHLLDDPARHVERLAELLTPDGSLISETPCLADRNLVTRALVSFAVRAGLAPMIHPFRAADVEDLVSAHGFRIVESRVEDRRSAIQWVLAQRT